MSRVEEIQKQIEELEKKTQELQKELEIEKAKAEIECPFEERERYFVLCNDGSVSSDCWEDDDCELDQLSQGNMFKTKEEAECERDRRNLLTRFRQFRDKCNGDWKPDFENSREDKYSIMFHYKSRKLKIANSGDYDNFRPFSYFKNESDTQRDIELFGDEIKRLYVEE